MPLTINMINITIKSLLYGTIFILILAFIIVSVGYAIYKTERAESWNKGSYMVYKRIWNIFQKLFNILKKIGKMIWKFLKWILPILGTWFYEEATGNALPPKPEDRICKDVSLADSEIDELVGEFNRQPYLTPILAEPVCAYDGILWIHIKSAGLDSKYANLPLKDLKRLIENIVKGFYQKHRRLVNIDVFVRVATATETIIAIPFTMKSVEYVKNQMSNDYLTEDVFTEKALTESIPVEEMESNHDYRL